MSDLPSPSSVRARVTVFPRAEILDPQGKAISQALGRLDFSEVAEVRAGKAFDIELHGDDAAHAQQRLHEMAERLLSNPITEDFEIEILDGADGGTP